MEDPHWDEQKYVSKIRLCLFQAIGENGRNPVSAETIAPLFMEHNEFLPNVGRFGCSSVEQFLVKHPEKFLKIGRLWTLLPTTVTKNERTQIGNVSQSQTPARGTSRALSSFGGFRGGRGRGANTPHRASGTHPATRAHSDRDGAWRQPQENRYGGWRQPQANREGGRREQTPNRFDRWKPSPRYQQQSERDEARNRAGPNRPNFVPPPGLPAPRSVCATESPQRTAETSWVCTVRSVEAAPPAASLGVPPGLEAPRGSSAPSPAAARTPLPIQERMRENEEELAKKFAEMLKAKEETHRKEIDALNRAHEEEISAFKQREQLLVEAAKKKDHPVEDETSEEIVAALRLSSQLEGLIKRVEGTAHLKEAAEDLRSRINRLGL